MERTRVIAAALSGELAPLELASVDSSRRALPLRQWVDTVLSPGVTLGDVEALLACISGPLAHGESQRERADQLLRILGDEALEELHGEQGREVCPAALEALLALGYPYALEVPPEVLERLKRLRGQKPRALARASRWGLRLSAVGALWPSMMLAVTTQDHWWLDYLTMMMVSAGVLFLPAVVSALAEQYRLRWVKSLCNAALGLMGCVGLLSGPVSGDVEVNFFTLPVGLAMLSSAICLRHREEVKD